MHSTEIQQDCWNQIGVWGKSEKYSCPRLEEVVHCRNCPVFREAGKKLFERPMPEDYLREWTQTLAEEKEPEPEETVSVLIFRLKGQWLAINAHFFQEILDSETYLQYVHSIPQRKNPILKGIINIQGEMEIYVSLEHLLHITAEEQTAAEDKAYQRLAVLQNQQGSWVFAADEIYGLESVDIKSFENVPATVGQIPQKLTRGVFNWKDLHVAYLDAELLLAELAGSIR
jgi:chemotaxis-related protein WspD